MENTEQRQFIAPADVSPEKIVEIILEEWRDSEQISRMVEADLYYRSENAEIQSKQRGYTDENGTFQENEYLSNAKLPSGFLKMSVDQKVNYAFAKNFTISANNPEIELEKNEKDEDAELYLSHWRRWFTSDNMETIKAYAKDAINKGIGWLYVWIQNGKLQAETIVSETLYPQWEDVAKKKLQAVVRDYKTYEYDEDEEEMVERTRVEYWTAEEVHRFIDDEGDLIVDVEMEGVEEIPFATAHHIREEADAETGEPVGKMADGWGRVPFIAFKSGRAEMTLLQSVKTIIDAIDYLESKMVDGLLDDMEPILMIEDITADYKKLLVMRNMLKTSQMATIDKGGKAYYLQVRPDVTAIHTTIEHLYKMAHKFSATIDSQDVKFGANPSGVALKSVYADLDVYMNGLETEFRAAINRLKYFFDRWLEFSGVGTAEQWEQYEITIELDRDMLINEEGIIRNVMEMARTNPDYRISSETLNNMNPYVEDHETELARLDAERERIQGGDSELAELQNQVYANREVAE